MTETCADRQPQSGGFTLMEIVIVVVLIGILVALAAPNMGAFVTRTNVDAVLNELVGDINYARMLAVRSGNSATLATNGSGTAYTITTRVPDAAGTGTVVRQAKRVNLASDAPGFTLSGSPTGTLTFNSRGLLTSDATNLRVQGRGQADSVMVLISGRPFRFY